jgi:RNA polymerase sigma-70 factor (ECF subfamily)
MRMAETVALPSSALGGVMTWDQREAESGGDGDEFLVAASRAGDPEAFDHLVERYQRRIYRFCHRWSGDHADAADLAQEVFLRAYRGISKFRGESALSTWLYRIALNVCRSFHASRRAPAEELAEGTAVIAAEGLDRVERTERAQAVRDAIRKLPEKQRATLVLKVYHDLTHEEIAAILGTSVGTAKANLFHALGNLRKQLSALGGAS